MHGPSVVTDWAFPWTDSSWPGVARSELVLYELHVGVFSRSGTFDGVRPHLKRLRHLGATALELMPVAAFDGPRGWGYDGVAPFAVHGSYGGPTGLMRLVDAAHREGLAVLLDVVYNHLGPSGNYLREFGPYFNARRKTPWGDAVNFDGPDSRPVRDYFIQNALQWVRDFHLDGLRLDAVHGIVDRSPVPIVQEIAEAVARFARRAGRRIHVIAESDANDPSLVQKQGLSAVWNDDFHHALHALVTGERRGYYVDYGRLSDLAKAYEEGFVLSGQRSLYRGAPHGRSSAGIRPGRFVTFAQNHDQIGNRPRGDRLAAHLSPRKLRFVAAAVALAPAIPLFFMGEEYAERAPFPYFTSFGEGALAQAIRTGRAKEFARFAWREPPWDPESLRTFSRARLRPERGDRVHTAFIRRMLAARRSLRLGEARRVAAQQFGGALRIQIGGRRAVAALALNPSDEPCELPLPRGEWRVALDSALEERRGGRYRDRLAMGPWQAVLLVVSGRNRRGTRRDRRSR